MRRTSPIISLNLNVGLVSFPESTCIFAVCLISPFQNICGWLMLVPELVPGLGATLIKLVDSLDLDCWRVLTCRGVAKCCLLAEGFSRSSSSDSELAVDVDGVGPWDETRSSIFPRRRFWRANRSFSSWARSDRKLFSLEGVFPASAWGVPCCGVDCDCD